MPKKLKSFSKKIVKKLNEHLKNGEKNKIQMNINQFNINTIKYI
jgi:hypothetical protein